MNWDAAYSLEFVKKLQELNLEDRWTLLKELAHRFNSVWNMAGESDQRLIVASARGVTEENCYSDAYYAAKFILLMACPYQRPEGERLMAMLEAGKIFEYRIEFHFESAIARVWKVEAYNTAQALSRGAEYGVEQGLQFDHVKVINEGEIIDGELNLPKRTD